MRLHVYLLFTCLLGAALPAGAQTPATRADALRAEREAKAQRLEPPKPDPLKRGLDLVESRVLLLVQPRDGFYPKFGSLTRAGGLMLGVGYRNHDVFARYGALDLWAAGTLKKYWGFQVGADFPELAGGRVMANATATLRDYPEEDFFGLGADSLRSNFTSYSLRTRRITGRAGVRPVRVVTVGGHAEHSGLRTGRGHDASVPSIEQLFSPSEAPGMFTDTDFLRTGLFVDVDYRRPRNARYGGWYRLDLSRYDDQTSSRFDFERADVDLRQYLGFLAGRRVIALRAYMSTTDADDGAQTPFFLMPTLGGNESLRGFRNFRFRGPHALLLQAEYRWEIWSGLEGAFFYDTGKVTNDRRDLNLENLQKDYGIGFRFNTDNGVVMRIDAAFGSRDGRHLHIVFSGVF